MLKIEDLIITKEQYKIALERVYKLMQLDLEANSSELKEAELLGILIERYEKIHFSMKKKDPSV
jgi:antitoxin component HigA of HigAB toxin-antitoxin module